jgi:lysophospholipase L1-like esterase
MQPSPEIQPRKWSVEEKELLRNYDAVSGLREVFNRCRRDYEEWHAADMAELARELGFTWVDINARLNGRFDREWLHIDHIHMIDQGYRRAAEEIAPLLV